MTDPVFLARLLAASLVAVVLALCATNAKDSGAEPILHPVHSTAGSH